ncbi:hypothetical protein K2173_015856 [Erythroxylum novogranatense]|uniref:Protein DETOXIFICATION n=1 Tax=Erythroxylum novogranatense TaxID=1862640 RepID=A0AAV8SFH2_9ROSI|nr:hypothetical protein K2173_015856 [Erythroxylum novogranatense]
MDLEEEKPSFESPPIQQQTELEHKHGFNKVEIVEEVKKQLWLAGPLVSVSFLIFLLQVISVMFVGHLGELALSSASMATSFAAVTGFSLLRGMGSSLDTFCGQSYGARHYRMLGIHLQRAMIVLLLVSIPLAIVWANAGRILVFLRQDPEISAEAGKYARFMIPSIFGFAIQECHTRFLQTQNNVIPMMVSAGLTTCMHIFICWILVFKSGLGNKGAAVANAISYWINAMLLVLYVWISPSCKKCWTGFSREALQGIPNFLRLAIPSALMLSLEIWSFELIVLLSGLLPNPKLETSVVSISLNACAMIYMIPLGLGSAISTIVSNELGAGRPRAARLSVHIVVLMVVAESILVGSIVIITRNYWGYLYSKENDVVKYVGQMFLLIGVWHTFDGIQSVLAGTLRGCGRQKIGAVVNLSAYYLMGIPCSVLLAFIYHLRGKGLWIGMMVAMLVQAVAFCILTIRIHWDQEAVKARERLHKAMISADPRS